MLAIVLSRRDFGESDQLISLYTLERGKVEALAKGVKKIISKNSSALEPFCLVEADFAVGRGMEKIIRARLLNSFAVIRADLGKSQVALYATRVLEKLVGAGQKDEQIFGLMFRLLEYLQNKRENIPDEVGDYSERMGQFNRVNETLVYSFIVKLLALLGFSPQLLEDFKNLREFLEKDFGMSRDISFKDAEIIEKFATEQTESEFAKFRFLC